MQATPKSYDAIMVSSTFTDLEAHRREVIDAIHRFGFHANVMEYSGARSDADVIDTSLQMVRDSVAYLCVIGHKYGQTPQDEDRNPNGLSITELEFNEARRLGRPILLFLMSDDHPVTKGDVEPDAKKRKKLEAFRKQARRIDPGAAPERVYETFASKDEFAKKAAIAVGLQAIHTAGRSDLPDRAIRDAIARFIDIKPEANAAALTEAIERFESDYRALEQQLTAIIVSDNRVTALKADAEAALAEGDLDKARTAYRDAAEAARDKAVEPVRTAAELKAAEAGAHLLALDWQAADVAWADAAAMLAPFDSDAADRIVEAASERLSTHGDGYARAGALSAAINRLRALAASAEARAGERETARLRSNLAAALQTQGNRTGGPEGLRLLDEAVTVYRDIIKVLSCTAEQTIWATTQNNLGAALRKQGERTDGHQGERLLDEAVAAYRSALSVFTRSDVPERWANIQNNLGIALRLQGERTEGAESERLFDEAVTAFRSALTVYAQSDKRHHWAGVLNNIGILLTIHGEFVGGAEGISRLEEAVEAFRDVLTVFTRVDTPADWAMTQNNLANALQTRAELTSGIKERRLLEEAVTAYRDVLTVYTHSDASADWAKTQENIGIALELMAEADTNHARAHLLGAEAALLAALSVYTPEHMGFYYKKAADSLVRVRAKLAALNA